MDYETLRFERREPIGILTLNRPDRLNAMSWTMQQELSDFFEALRRDLKIRVVIVRGEGRAFCAGLDLTEFDKAPQPDDLGEAQRAYQFPELGMGLMVKMRRAPQGLIAAVRGSAAGGGFNLAMACDVRIAGESARFNAAYARLGFQGGDQAASYFLPRLIGLSRATEYLMTGKFMDAATAERIGFVSRVVPDAQVDAAAIEAAEEMLRMSPFALRLTKESLDFAVGVPSLESVIQIETRNAALLLMTEDSKVEGPRAFFEKRPPQWHDR